MKKIKRVNCVKCIILFSFSNVKAQRSDLHTFVCFTQKMYKIF